MPDAWESDMEWPNCRDCGNPMTRHPDGDGFRCVHLSDDPSNPTVTFITRYRRVDQ